MYALKGELEFMRQRCALAVCRDAVSKMRLGAGLSLQRKVQRPCWVTHWSWVARVTQSPKCHLGWRSLTEEMLRNYTHKECLASAHGFHCYLGRPEIRVSCTVS